MPDAPGLELIRASINDRHEGAVIDTTFDAGRGTLVVAPGQVLDVLTWLKETPGQEYTFLSSLHGVDYLPAEPRFGVHYELLNRDRVERLRVKALLADPAEGETGAGAMALPEIPSCTHLFPTANFQEREAFDFFGIIFDGHPDLTRILLPDDYVGWPLRRDFPIGGEPVIFTHNEPGAPGVPA